jgi:hypothetical protein
MSLKQLAVALCWFGTLGVHAWSARADDIEDFGPKRELAQHVFFPSLIVADPFLSTYLSMDIAAGYDWITGPDFDVLGNLMTARRSYDAQAMAEGASFQASVTDFMAIRVAAGGGIDAGGNARSAVVVGAIQPIIAGAGTTLSWRLQDIVRAGFTFDFVYSHTKLVQPLNAIEDSLLAGDVEPARASQTLNGYTLRPGATVAVVPCPSVGFLASVIYNWTAQVDDTTQYFNALDVGGSAQLDLLPASAIPIGLLASYRATIPFESAVRFTNTLEAGVFYTGRKDLDLGITAEVKWYDLHPQHVIRLDTTQLVGIAQVRYHWN